jgi:hypothetical protein
MNCEIVPLNPEYLDKLLEGAPPSMLALRVDRAYFSPGSVSCCLLADGVPVFAGGIVNLGWNRGEGWFMPTIFFRRNVKTCYRALRKYIPRMALENGFARVQATCVKGVSASILKHLGFAYEGTMRKFGPFGETCDMWAQFFEVKG